VLHNGYVELRERLKTRVQAGGYSDAFRAIASFAPLLARYFLDVFVMTDDIAVRENRLRLMRAISETCSSLARLELLGDPARKET
jgi:glycyl-tRNA synthetase beta chain